MNAPAPESVPPLTSMPPTARETQWPVTAATPAQPAPVSPHLGCTVCASGVTTPHGAGGTPGQAAGVPREPLEALIRAWSAKADEPDRDPYSAAAYRIAKGNLVDVIAAAREPHAAPGESSPLGLKHAVTSNRLGHALAALREIRDGDDALHELVQRAQSALADDAAIRDNVVLTREPEPVPELAAAQELAAARAEVIEDMLSRFGPSGSGHTARVGQVQIARWRTRAGLTS